jgi:DNA repair exonuclease SbcCD ATPase subunit
MATLGITTLASRLAASARLGMLRRPRGADPLPVAALAAELPHAALRQPKSPSAAAERAGDELEQAREHIRSLERQVASYLQQYALAKDTLKKEIRQKNATAMELAAANAQVSALLGRIHELEMEHGIGRAASTTVLEAMVRDAALATRQPLPLAPPAGAADQAALRGEIERWKRHCQTLGAALKQERARRQSDR